MFKTRKEEHKEESDEASLKHYTRGNRKISEKEFNKSAIKDHVSQNNHTMSWEEVSIVAKEVELVSERNKTSYLYQEGGRTHH